MSRNSKAKRDARKKAERKPAPNTSMLEMQRSLNDLFDPKKLTSPSDINDDIRQFCLSVSPATPFFIEVHPEPWSRQGCCDLNVKEFIKANGGTLVCGYRIWYHFPHYIEAERHAIWELEGKRRDISFNPDGESRVLFLPDVPERQAALELNERRLRWGKNSKTRQLIALQEQMESHMQIQQMSNEEAWGTMPTFEQWQQGARMPNLIPVIR